MKSAFTINSFRTDPTGWIGAAAMFAFACIAGWRWYESGLIFYILTFLRDVAATWLLLTRNADCTSRRLDGNTILAYISSAMPLMYFGQKAETAVTILALSNCLSIVGFTLATLALFDLGRSFGVSAANRGKVQTGVYRVIQHPMYTGYLVSEIGMVFLNPVNIFLFAISSALYFLRAKVETRVINADEAASISACVKGM